MARTYLKLDPDVNLLILDAGTSIGGVWASDRLYPFLRTISQFGHFEYSDFPMTGYGVQQGEHMKGDVIRQYLEDYAQFFDLTRRTRLNSIVREAEDKGADGWLLTVSAKDDSATATYQIHASKLVMATGLTSTPSMPSLPGRESFTAPLFHSRDFGPRSSTTLRPGTRVAVLSGNKSACDVVYAHAASGAAVVHWIIRASGHGPCWMAPPRATSRQILVEKLITTRAVTWLNPCIWGPSDGFGYVRRVVNQTPWGQRLMRSYAQGGQAGVEKHNGYATHAELAKLRPWNDIFWIGTGRGLLNYEAPDVFELVRQGRIEVHVADVAGLEGRAVRLGDGAVVEGVDALVCSTGWDHRPPVRFVRGGADISAELGVPHAFGKGDEEDGALVARADREILEAIPRLRDQPKPARPPHLRDEPCQARDPAERTMEGSYALYRFMVPPSRIHTRTLAFAGVVRTPVTAMIAEMQALWLSAFFSRQMPHLDADVPSSLAPPSPKLSTPAIEKGAQDAEMRTEQSRAEISARVKYESILHARYGLWRYPYGFGAVMPDFFFDSVPLFDLMGSELGLRRWRKANMVKEILSSYGPQDYVGMVDEWRENRKNGIVVTRLEQAERKRALMTVAVVLALWITVMMCLGGWVWSNL